MTYSLYLVWIQYLSVQSAWCARENRTRQVVATGIEFWVVVDPTTHHSQTLDSATLASPPGSAKEELVLMITPLLVKMTFFLTQLLIEKYFNFLSGIELNDWFSKVFVERCPNVEKGCSQSMSVAECEMHLTSCRFNNISSEPVTESSVCPSCGDAVEDSKSMGSHLRLICPNKKVACTFATAGCTVKLPRFQLGAHIANQTSSHMQLLAGQLNKIQQTQQV